MSPAIYRLVAVQDIAIEADFGKHLLYVRNKDKPGFIGAIGTVLGSAGINIATFHLGRTAPRLGHNLVHARDRKEVRRARRLCRCRLLPRR